MARARNRCHTKQVRETGARQPDALVPTLVHATLHSVKIDGFLAVHRQLACTKRSHFRLVFGCLFATLGGGLIVAFKYQPEAVRTTSQVASRFGFENLADDLELKSKILEMERIARESFGTEVTRVELSRSRWDDFGRFIADYLPDGKELGFLTLPGNRFLSFIPKYAMELFDKTFG